MAVFSLKAILTKRVFQDTFTRSDASSWGTDYTVTFLQSGATASVNGSEARLTTNKSLDATMDDSHRVAAGMILFDFYIPANISDGNEGYFILNGGSFPAWAEVFLSSGSTWQADLYTIYGSDDPFVNFTPVASTWYRYKAFWSGFPNGPMGVKIWKTSDPEPVYGDFGTQANPDQELTDPLDWFDLELSFSAPFAEVFRWDNFEIWTFGTPADPTTRATFTLNAVIKRLNVTGSFTFNAVLTPRHFSLDAWVLGGAVKHDRQLDHFGTELDNVIVLSGPIGQYPTGMDLHTVLTSMVGRILRLESAAVRVGGFTFSAWLSGFTLRAVLKKSGSAHTATLDASIIGGKSTGFTVNAYLKILSQNTFTLEAYLIDDVCV